MIDSTILIGPLTDRRDMKESAKTAMTKMAAAHHLPEVVGDHYSRPARPALHEGRSSSFPERHSRMCPRPRECEGGSNERVLR